MKVCVIQPRYSMDARDLDARFSELLSLLDECDESLDLIAGLEGTKVVCQLLSICVFCKKRSNHHFLLSSLVAIGHSTNTTI